MKAFHRLDFRVHAHATEVEGRVREALAFLSGTDDPTVKKTEGHHGNAITIFTTRLARSPEIQTFWDLVRSHGQMPAVLSELEPRMDARGLLFLRFDKQEAYRGHVRLVRHDDVVMVKAKVAAYPGGKENALAAARAYLGEA